MDSAEIPIRLYTPDRLAGKTSAELRALLEMVVYDFETESVVYEGLSRAATRSTASWSREDIERTLQARVLEELHPSTD